MESGMISKIQKAKRYAQERERITFDHFRVHFRGEHGTYTTTFDEGKWSCQCNFFLSHGVCSHTMALERILGVMIPREAETESVLQSAGSAP